MKLFENKVSLVKPNIVYILADEMGYGDILGHPTTLCR